MKTNEQKPQRECQSFRQGCCGCCVNMRWSDEKIMDFLRANTVAAESVISVSTRPGLWTLVRLHWARCGWLDHLLAGWLVFPTFGLSAWVWKRWLGSCQFAGFLDYASGRVGCLIHPVRLDGMDLRRHAFPLIPTVGCNRALLCPMLFEREVDLQADALTVSRFGQASLARRKSLPCSLRGNK